VSFNWFKRKKPNPDAHRPVWQVTLVRYERPGKEVWVKDLTLKQARAVADDLSWASNVVTTFVERMPGK